MIRTMRLMVTKFSENIQHFFSTFATTSKRPFGDTLKGHPELGQASLTEDEDLELLNLLFASLPDFLSSRRRRNRTTQRSEQQLCCKYSLINYEASVIIDHLRRKSQIFMEREKNWSWCCHKGRDDGYCIIFLHHHCFPNIYLPARNAKLRL